jgi:hypothetical protein
MRMAQHHCIDLVEIERKGVTIGFFFLSSSLYQAAVDQNLMLAIADNMA